MQKIQISIRLRNVMRAKRYGFLARHAPHTPYKSHPRRIRESGIPYPNINFPAAPPRTVPRFSFVTLARPADRVSYDDHVHCNNNILGGGGGGSRALRKGFRTRYYASSESRIVPTELCSALPRLGVRGVDPRGGTTGLWPIPSAVFQVPYRMELP